MPRLTKKVAVNGFANLAGLFPPPDGAGASRTETLRRLARGRNRRSARVTDDDGSAPDEHATSPFLPLPSVAEAIRVCSQPLDFALLPIERTGLPAATSLR